MPKYDTQWGEYKYVMVCIQCEKTFRSISGIEQSCHRCQAENRKRNKEGK